MSDPPSQPSSTSVPADALPDHDPGMSQDPLSLLRRFHHQRRLGDVMEVEGRIVFFEEGGNAVWWPSDVGTSFGVHGSDSDGRCSLGSIVSFMKGLKASSSVRDTDGQSVLDFMNTGKTLKRIGDPSSLRTMTPRPKMSRFEEEESLTMRSGGPSAMEVPESGSAPGPNEQAGSSRRKDDEPAKAVQVPAKGKKIDTNCDHFSGLPDEVVVKILAYLKLEDIATRVSLVNHRFKDLCMDPSLWTRLELPGVYRLDKAAAMKLIKRCTLLEELNYKNTYYRRIDSRILATSALKSCPKLKKLVVYSKDRNTKNLEQVLKAIGKYGCCLREFELEGRCSTKALKANAGCLSNLTRVKLDMDFAEFDLKLVVDYCKCLEHVRLLNIRLTDDVFNYFLEGVQGTLKHLSLGYGLLTDASFKNLKKCQKLETLEMRRSFNLQSEGFKAISELTELKELAIACCDSIDDDYYINHQAAEDLRLFEKLKNLTNLALISTFTNVDLKAVVDICPELTKLTIFGCHDISDEGVDYALLNCHKLTTLEVRGSTRWSLVELRNIQPSLRELNFSSAHFDGLHFDELQVQKVRLEALYPDLKVIV